MVGSFLPTHDVCTISCGSLYTFSTATSWQGILAPRLGAGVKAVHSSTRHRHVLQAWKGVEDADIAVFRFTLGIPGFNDALLPRIVGILGAALLIANHLSDQGAATAAQVRTEGLGAVLSALCIATPSIGARLQAAQPGRGRTAGSAGQSSGQVFQVAPELPDDVRVELAWASYSLLRNTNSSGLLVAGSNGNVQVIRGAVRQAAGTTTGQAALIDTQKGLQLALERPSSPLAEAMTSVSGPVYLPDAAALGRAGLKGTLLPDSACSALVQPLRPLPERATTAGGSQEAEGGARSSSSSTFGESRAETDTSGNGSSGVEAHRGGAPAAGVLLLWSDRPRALSQRERMWAAAVASKLCDTLS